MLPAAVANYYYVAALGSLLIQRRLPSTTDILDVRTIAKLLPPVWWRRL